MDVSGDHTSSLLAAARNRSGVVISYRRAGDPLPHNFLLYPWRVYAQNGHRYVVGWSAHRPTRIKLRRVPPSLRRSGMIRRFRLDRMLAVTDRPAPDWSAGGYVRHHILQRGILGALRIIVIDVFVLAAILAIAITVVARFWTD